MAEVVAGKESDRKNHLGRGVMRLGGWTGSDLREMLSRVPEPGSGSWAVVAGLQAQDLGKPYRHIGSGPASQK